MSKRRPNPLSRIAKLRGGKLTGDDLRLFARLAGQGDLAGVVDDLEDLQRDLAVLKNWRALDEHFAEDPDNLLDRRP